MCLGIEHPATRCHGWQKSNMNVRSWALEVTRELYDIRLAFMWRREITKTINDMCNNIEREEYFSKISGKSSLTLYREMNCWGKR